MLALTIVTMSAASFVLGLLPTFSSVGYCSFLEFGTTGGFVLAAGLVTALEFGLSAEAMGSRVGLAILAGLLVMLMGMMSATLPALFDTDVRYGGFSIGYNISTSLFGGTAPAILALLVTGTGNNASPGIYVAGAALISLIAVVKVRESAGRPLPGSPPSVLATTSA